MRGSRIGLYIGAAIMLATGGGLAWQASASSLARTPLLATGVALALGAVALLVAARFVGGMDAGRLRAQGGLPGTARILSLADTGVTVGGLTAVLRADAEVSVAGRPPYRASFRLPVGRHQLGQLAPGAVLPVLVDPAHPQRIVLDDRPTVAVGGQARSSSAIVRDGERGEGVIVSAEPSGRTAGEAAPGAGLAPDEADDPVAIVRLRVEAIGRTPFEAVTALRVPDGKHGVLVPGRRVPVAFLAHDPASTTTIDWARA